MLDVKNNFRGKYKDTKCRKCTETIESQEHVLETCTGIHDDDTTKINTNDIFDSNPTNLKTYKNSSRVTKWHHPDSDSTHVEVQQTSIKHLMDAKTTLCALQLDY